VPDTLSLKYLLGSEYAPIQPRIILSKAYEVAAVTGMGGGKTYAACVAAMRHAVRFPQSRILIGRLTYDEMLRTTKDTFFKMVEDKKLKGYFERPTRWDVRERTNYARLHNGSEMFFSNLDKKLGGSKNVEYCVPENTRALTRSGWKTKDQLFVGEDILTYNAEKHTKEWTPLLGIVNYPSAELQEINGTGKGSLKFRCTSGHRWFVRQRRTHLGSHHLPYYHDEIRETSQLDSQSFIRTNAPMGIDIGAYDSSWDLNRTKYGTNWTATICSMSSKERQAFLLGFLLADGHQDAQGHWLGAQKRGELFEAFLTAAYIEHGGAVAVYHNSGNDLEHIRLCARPHATRLVRRPAGAAPVWCPITKNGSWVARQGDSITITGNSLIIIDQAEEILFEVYRLLLLRARMSTIPPEERHVIVLANDEGDNWIRDRFKTFSPPHGWPSREATRELILGSSLANPHLDSGARAQLLALPPEIQRRWVNPTMEGVRFEPCLLAMTLVSLPSMMATTELVVPRSIPMILPILPPVRAKRDAIKMPVYTEPFLSRYPRGGWGMAGRICHSGAYRVQKSFRASWAVLR